ncbi:MAG TPA: substrate-binding domain-containing protein [Thermoplasmata archaeon]|nr:substrate-binding domain-containing protein [Thermoplasmata archaeon]
MLAKTLAWVVAIVVVGAGAAAAGYITGHYYPSASPSAVANSTLSILAAGSLRGQFVPLADLLVNETPGITAPTAAQNYEGSLDIVNGFTLHKTPADVAALADFRLAPQLLEPKYVHYEVAFGMTPEVLVYNPSIVAFDGINSSNWGWKLVNGVASSGLPFAVWNASTDPNGYNEIFSMELQGQLYNASNTSVFSHFYTDPPWKFAVPVSNPSVALPEPESAAATLIADDTVSALITYRSYAVANHLTYVSFNPIVGLDASNSTALADYHALSTTIQASTGGNTKVHAAPVVFAITVPLNAPNASLGLAFLHLLLSPQGSAILSVGSAFTPIYPGWWQATSPSPPPIPPVLAPDVGPMPGWAAALLT